MKSKKSKKSKRILACAISAALIISAASVSLSAFAAYTDYSEVPGYSDNGTADDKSDDYVQRTLVFEGEFESVISEKIPCTDEAMLEEDYAVEIKIPEDYIPTPESEGYEFTGWRGWYNDEIYQPGDTVSVISAIGDSEYYIYPEWKYVGKKTLVVMCYDGMQRNEATTIENIAPDTKSVTITAPDAPTNSANTFKGWVVYSYVDNKETVQPGEKVEITGIDTDNYGELYVEFFAVWEKDTLAFEQERSIAMYLPGDKYDEDSEQFEGTELYVKYFDEDVQTVKGTYSMETGVTTYEKGFELKAPSADQLPKKEGYTFKEWREDPFGFGETYKPGDVIDNTDKWISLYAIYTKDTSTYTVTTGYYDGDNWFMSKTEEVADDAESYVIEAPAALKNDKNTFKHWIGPDGNTYKPGDKITVSASELYDGATFDFVAVWEGKTISTQMTGYVVCLVPSTKDEKNSFKWDQDSEDYYKTYKSIKGKVKAVKDTETNKYTLYDNQTITIPKDTVPTKEGYVFKGWNTESDGSGKTYQPGDAVPVVLDESNRYVESVNLFAVFEKGSAANNGDTASPGSTDTNAPGTNNGDTASPGTGDDFNAVPYVAAAVVSLGAIAGVVALHKKKRGLADEAK